MSHATNTGPVEAGDSAATPPGADGDRQIRVRRRPFLDVRLPVPRSLGGRFYVESVSVGRDPDDDRVGDCAGCDGYVYYDRWHLAATVVGDDRREYRYCDDDCLRGWLAVAAD